MDVFTSMQNTLTLSPTSAFAALRAPLESPRMSTTSQDRSYVSFDADPRNTTMMVLTFDKKGNHAFEELNRNDILQRIRDAEVEREDAPPLPSLPSPPASPSRLPKGKRSRNGEFRGPIAATDLLGTYCDLQPTHMRDLRKLDTSFSAGPQEPSIVVRKQAILVSADPVRAVVMRNACLVLVPDGADKLLSLLINNFSECVHNKDNDTPYEFTALEAILDTLSRTFTDEFEGFALEIGAMLDTLVNVKIVSGELESLRVMKSSIDAFERQVDSLRRALIAILDNEEDMRLLYVTKLYNEPNLVYNLGSFDSEEVEVLLEAYLKDIYSTCTKAALLQHRIDATESLVTMKLDYGRNYLLALDLVISLVGVGLTVGTLISGIYGMNVKLVGASETSTSSFWWVIGAIVLGGALVVSSGVLFFRRQGLMVSV